MMKRQSEVRFVIILCAVLLPYLKTAESQEARLASDFGAMGLAKELCSSIFVSGRQLEEALLNSGHFASEPNRKMLAARIGSASGDGIRLDRAAGTLAVTIKGFTGRARFYGDQGCVILPPGFDGVFFEPLPVESTLPDPMTQPWPMGDKLPAGGWPRGLNKAKVEEAVEAAFEGEGLTASFVVVYKGQIVGERYGQGADN